MKTYNFKTVNGENLVDLLATGEEVPIHLPTPRNYEAGEVIRLTYGNRVHPTHLADVKIIHEHSYETDESVGQNLIVRWINDVGIE